MAGLLSGLEKLGLEGWGDLDIFGSDEDKKTKKREPEVVKQPVILSEEDFIYDKTFNCPVCGKEAVSKVMKTSKAKSIGMDADLRPKYDGIDSQKYDVVLCKRCGYSALTRYFEGLMPAKAKLIKENITPNVTLTKYDTETVSYDEAMERYKLALACAVVSRAKASEKAYICLKSAWTLRGYQEELAEQGGADDKIEALKAQEKEYLQNAYTGFIEARKTENFPIAGMDEKTLDYLLAQLAYTFGQMDVAAKLVAGILGSNSVSPRIKDKARDLKDLILAARNKK